MYIIIYNSENSNLILFWHEKRIGRHTMTGNPKPYEFIIHLLGTLQFIHTEMEKLESSIKFIQHEYISYIQLSHASEDEKVGQGYKEYWSVSQFY